MHVIKLHSEEIFFDTVWIVQANISLQQEAHKNHSVDSSINSKCSLHFLSLICHYMFLMF